MSMLQTTTMEEYVSRCKYLRTFMCANYDCPTGHYQLDMPDTEVEVVLQSVQPLRFRT